MSKINAVCVYCGSSPGTEPVFVEARARLRRDLAENGVRLVYGGGSVGLMGAVAEAVLEHGGDMTGIIPEFLTRRERPDGWRRNSSSPATCMSASADVRARRRLRRAAGRHRHARGTGRAVDLGQLGRHKKPILIANIKGYWDPLLVLIDHMRDIKFCRRRCKSTIWSPSRWKTSCRCCGGRAQVPTKTTMRSADDSSFHCA